VRDDRLACLEQQNAALEVRLVESECTERELAASRELMACYVERLHKCERDLQAAQRGRRLGGSGVREEKDVDSKLCDNEDAGVEIYQRSSPDVHSTNHLNEL